MKVTLPQEINDTTLLASNVPVDDYPAWTAGTYNRGDRVVKGKEVFEVLAVTTPDDPAVGIRLDPPSWLRLGFVNRWRMFTGAADSQTRQATDIDVTVSSEQDFYDTLALLGLEGQTVTVQVLDALDVVVWERTVDLVDIGVDDWWEYYFAPYDQIESVAFDDVFYQSEGKIRVLIESSGDAACGRLALGVSNEVGETNHGTSTGLLTFNRFERNGFGDLSLREGRTTNIVNFNVTVPRPRVAAALRTLRRAGGKIALYVGEAEEEGTIILGIAEEPRINYDTPSISSLTLEVQGV